MARYIPVVIVGLVAVGLFVGGVTPAWWITGLVALGLALVITVKASSARFAPFVPAVAVGLAALGLFFAGARAGLVDHRARRGRDRTRRLHVEALIRLLVRTAIALVANAVALIVTAALVDDVRLDITGFVVAVVVFTVVFALAQPFLVAQLRGSPGPVLGGVALIATLVSLIVTVLVTDGLSIDGLTGWIVGTLVVWLASVLAALVVPFLGLKKYLDERR